MLAENVKGNDAAETVDANVVDKFVELAPPEVNTVVVASADCDGEETFAAIGEVRLSVAEGVSAEVTVTSDAPCGVELALTVVTRLATKSPLVAVAELPGAVVVTAFAEGGQSAVVDTLLNDDAFAPCAMSVRPYDVAPMTISFAAVVADERADAFAWLGMLLLTEVIAETPVKDELVLELAPLSDGVKTAGDDDVA